MKWITDTSVVKLYSDENCENEITLNTAVETLTVYAKGNSAGDATITAISNADSTKSASCVVTVNKADPSIETIPTASSITYGQKLSDSTLTGGIAKLGDTSVEGTFAWKNTETKPAVSDSDTTEYDVVFTPTDTDNYAAVECKVKLTVNKAEPTVTAPTAKTLTYTGSAQELVNAGSTNDGTLYYAVTTDNTSPTDDNLYTTSIPSKTDAGTYYVWYKVAGDTNHNDATPDKVSVNISAASIAPKVSLTGWTYGGTANTSSVTGNTGNGAVAYSYKVKGAADSTYVATVPSNAGDYTVRASIVAAGNYKAATATADFTIVKADPTVQAPSARSLTYTGAAQALVNAGSTDDGTLYYAVTTEDKAPTDENLYTTSIPAKTDAGTYYVWYKVKGDVNHADSTASAPVTVTISPVNKDALNAAVSAAEAYYDEIKGNADYAAIAETLKKAIDAARAVAGNDNATEEQVGAAISSVTEAMKTAKADKEAAETIDIANCKISVKNQTYTGKALKPAVTVEYGEVTLKKGTDYTVSYNNNRKIGRATVTVKGMGHYTGSGKLTFKICQKGTRFTTAKGGKQQIVLKWKNPKNVTGYVLQYSLKKNFSGKKTVVIRKAGTLSRIIGNLKANKTYYVRIRTYATVKNEHFRSSWSKVVAVKTKAGMANNVPDGQAVEATAEGEDMTLVLDGELDEGLLSEDIVVLPEALPEEDIPLTLAD